MHVGVSCAVGLTKLNVCDTWRPAGWDRGASAGTGGGSAGAWGGSEVTRLLPSSREARAWALMGSEGAGAAAGGGWEVSIDTATAGPGAAARPPVQGSQGMDWQ